MMVILVPGMVTLVVLTGFISYDGDTGIMIAISSPTTAVLNAFSANSNHPLRLVHLLFYSHRILSFKRVLRSSSCSWVWCKCQSWSGSSNDYNFLNITTNNVSKHSDIFT